jgi:prepilin-type N-terminal cleavage/methylation domain-containing protein
VKAGNGGFTLLELMIVVGILSILAAIAIPQWHRAAAKARQAEARIQLSNVYAVQSSFAVANESFTLCMMTAGVAAQGSARFYSVGVKNSGTMRTTCGFAGNGVCDANNWNSTGAITRCTLGAVAPAAPTENAPVAATAKILGSRPPAQDADFPTATYGGNVADLSSVDQNSFLVAAIGQISTATPAMPAGCVNEIDVWVINQDKSLGQLCIGL